MAGDIDRELQIAVAEGVLAAADAAALADEAARADRSPLSLLVERGQLSPDSVVSLRALAVDDGARPRPAPRFPIVDRERYTMLRFLGQGGMGQVFLVRDHRLQRDVAIKFVRGDDRGHVHQLLDEARAQARVDHDRVCKVHEVGEIDGTVYIAMPYIAGRSLAALFGALSLRDAVTVIRDAAEGLHAAHRAGVIHRDIKPSNLLVEVSAGRAPRTYVVDFGLARLADRQDPHAAAVVGTPRYMAPEQARGDEVDPRADVYGLGATLHHALTGAPPAGPRHGEPGAIDPTEIDPTAPADLVAIVRRCLAPDPAARYGSAAALADDLGRFLAGEPVAARAAGGWYRLRKRVARHRRSALALAVAAAAAIAAISWAVVVHGRGEVRASAVRRFTERIEAIEAAARFSALSPAHDVRGDRAAIRDQLAALEREVRAAGPEVAGAGDSALGRGYLAIEDDARAVEHLQDAWQLGFREPRAAFALGVGFGRLYQQQRRAAERIGSPELRDSRLRAVDARYRAPLAAYLQAAAGVEDVPPAYLAALGASAAGSLDAALAALAGIAPGRPWWFEAEELRGDVLLARAQRDRDRGDVAAARDDVAAGRAAYAAAGAIAHSRPAIFVSLAELEAVALRIALYGEADAAPAIARVHAATAQALVLVPDDRSALVLSASADRSLAEDHTNHGRAAEASAAIDRAIAAARQAIAAAPAQPEPRFELSQIYRQAGELRESQQQDPSEPLRAAAAAADGIAVAARDGVYFDNVGLIFGILADYQDDAGQDAAPARDRSIDAYQHAVALDDRLVRAWINLGVGRVMRAQAPRAANPAADLDAAIAALDHDPDNVVAVFYRGEAHRLRAELARAHGRDAPDELAAALAAYRRGAALNPKLPHLYNGIGMIEQIHARDAWERGDDPDPAVDRARAAYTQAIAAAPDQGFGYSNVGDALAQRAALQRARGDDARDSLRRAIAADGEALRRSPDLAAAHANLAVALSLRAADDLARGRDPGATLDDALAAARRALAANPSAGVGHYVVGQALGLRARRDATRGAPASAGFRDAADELARAIELAPGDLDAAIALAEVYRAWARTVRDPAVVERGLAAVERALAIRSGWPDAYLLRSRLRARQAQLAAEPAARAALERLAAQDVATAVARQPRLATRP